MVKKEWNHDVMRFKCFFIMIVTKEYVGKVKIVKVNVEASTDLYRQLGMQSVPYFMMFKNDKRV